MGEMGNKKGRGVKVWVFFWRGCVGVIFFGRGWVDGEKGVGEKVGDEKDQRGSRKKGREGGYLSF